MVYSVLEQARVTLILGSFERNTNFQMKFSIQMILIFWPFLLYLAFLEVFSKDLKAALHKGYIKEPARGCFKELTSPVESSRHVYFT